MLALSMEYSSDRKGVCSFGTILLMFKKVYPVYQRFFSRAAEFSLMAEDRSHERRSREKNGSL